MASASIERQRKRRRNDDDGDPEFQVAPMVDVLLVLMLFFMAITSTEVLKKDPNLKLANAKNAKPADKNQNKKHEIVVNVKWDSVNNVAMFSLNEATFPNAAAMAGALAAAHDHDPAAYVLIRADKDVEYSNIADLMSTCGSAGISSVSFAVLLNGDETKPAGGATASAQ